MHQAEQGAMSVGERPHEPARFVRNVKVSADLEAVEGFEDEPENAENGDGPPAQAPVTNRELSLRGRRLPAGLSG